MNFQSTILTWHDFYSIVGTAAAGLVGLLFVGLSLHLRVVVTHQDVKALARLTLASLGLALVLALFMVIPEPHDPSTTGWNIVGSASFSILVVAQPLVVGIRSSHRALTFAHLMLRFGLTGLTFVAVVTGGAILVAGDYQAGLSWLVGASIALLVGALRNSWDLLVTVGAATMASTAATGPDVQASTGSASPSARPS
jgi:hypothetical protein